MKTTNTERYEELYQEAVGRYLNKIDWDITDWLDDDEVTEYAKLHKEIHGYCLFCGDEKCDEQCPQFGK